GVDTCIGGADRDPSNALPHASRASTSLSMTPLFPKLLFNLRYLSLFSGGRMNDYLLSLILGIVEGITEFLPVSSTAHLRLSEALLHISLSDPYWKMYSIVIQLGAILCLPVYFWSRIRKFVSTFPSGESGNRTVLTHPLSLTMLAFVVTGIPSFLLTKLIGKHLENVVII